MAQVPLSTSISRLPNGIPAVTSLMEISQANAYGGQTPVSLTLQQLSYLILGAGGNVRMAPGLGLQFYNFDTGLWHTLLCTGNPPTTSWDAGQAT